MMSRFTKLAAVAALGLGASACVPSSPTLSAANNPSLYSVHQPVVQHTNYVLDLQTEGGGLSVSEQQRLDAWFDSIGVAYRDRISIDEPDGYPAHGAREDVARVAAGRGLLLTDGAPLLSGDVQPGMVRVIASRATASVPGCPAWEGDPEVEIHSNTSANFGCAINSNLAAMVADPDDLVLGREGAINGSGTTASRAIRTYRERTPTGTQSLPSTTTSSGTGQ